jgi:hypothetical protein
MLNGGDNVDLFFWVLMGNAVLAIPVAYVAAQKGRSAAGFYFLSFFLSFFIGILVVLALPTISQPSPNDRDQIESVKCPFCAEWVKAEASVCRFCGRDIVASLEAQALAEQASAMEAEKAEVQRQILNLEELARGADLAQTTTDAKRAKRGDFYRKRSTRLAGAGIALLVAVGVSVLIANIPNINAAIEAQRVTAAKELLAQENRADMQSCKRAYQEIESATATWRDLRSSDDLWAKSWVFQDHSRAVEAITFNSPEITDAAVSVSEEIYSIGDYLQSVYDSGPASSALIGFLSDRVSGDESTLAQVRNARAGLADACAQVSLVQ